MWGPLSVQVAKLNSRTTLIAMLYTFDAHTPPSIFKHCNSRINCHSYSFVSTRSLKTTVQLLFEPYTNSYTRSNRRRRRTASFRHERSTRSSIGDSPKTLSSLSVLETLNIISRDDASQIRSRLPNPYGPFPSLGAASSPSAATSFGQLSLGPASPPPHQPSPQPPMPPMHNQMAVVPSIPPRAPQREVRARALWDYAGAVSRTKYV
jgi:hypothetical protein